jgi:Effector-associated domain 7
MTDPVTALTVGKIASLAFQEFIKSGAGELGKKFAPAAISKIKELRGSIVHKFQGNPDAIAAIEQVKNGGEEEIFDIATYLKAEMKKDPDFATQVQATAYEIMVRKLVEDALSDEELSNLCQDEFRKVYNQFTTGQTKSQRIRLLVEHVERQREVQKLLVAIEQINPNAYAEFITNL